MQANKAYDIDTNVQENYSLRCHFHIMVLGLLATGTTTLIYLYGAHNYAFL